MINFLTTKYSILLQKLYTQADLLLNIIPILISQNTQADFLGRLGFQYSFLDQPAGCHRQILTIKMTNVMMTMMMMMTNIEDKSLI